MDVQEPAPTNTAPTGDCEYSHHDAAESPHERESIQMSKAVSARCGNTDEIDQASSVVESNDGKMRFFG